MPEGPEIRRAAERVASRVANRPLRSVFFAFDHLKRFEGELAGRRVEAVDTHGKAMLTRFDNGLTLYSHNQLYGRWYVTARDAPPETGRSLRVALRTDAGSAWLYSASEIDVLDPAGLTAHPFLSRLGPDLFDPDLSVADVVDRLRDDAFRRRGLAALYLDQGFLAGLGNYLRSEILFQAGLDPRRRAGELDDREAEALAQASLALPRRSLETGGVTLPESLAEPRSRGRRRKRFWVFARAGRSCYRCGGTVLREARGGRRLYRCPGCQS